MRAPLDFDVVVIGGGPNGIAYANWIRHWRPTARVAVVERRARPGFKIGESLLSSATRSFIASGLPVPVLRRLFGNKNGIRFWWTSPQQDALERHVDVLDIEETFQVERRPLEMALHEAARDNGVTVMTGVTVDLEASIIDTPRKWIACRDADGTPMTLYTTVLCDASGPAAVLGRHLGLYRKAPERNQTFTTSSYYAYFRQISPVPVDLWDEPATRHICFPDGWMWFINLVSWDRTPDENLRTMIRSLIDHPIGPDESYPTRQELEERFGCTSERITSIGFVIRSDHERGRRMSAREAFEHYRRRHPAIERVMRHYELVESPYDMGKASYFSHRDLVHDSTRMAGDGWCLIGDAAAFVNPIFSPGLNLGSGTAYTAARATADALERGRVSEADFAGYQTYAASVYSALLNETDVYYRAFRHPDSYESALMLKLFQGAADVVQRGMQYDESDPYVHGLLEEDYRERVDAVRAILRDAEQIGRDPMETAVDVRQAVGSFLGDLLSRPDVRALELGNVFTEYDSHGRRTSGKPERRARFGVVRCATCTTTHDRTLERCPVCGRNADAAAPSVDVAEHA